MTDIKELAGRIIKECWQSPHSMSSGLKADIIDFATRFLAAYLAEQEPSSEEVREMVKRLREEEWGDAADMIERLAARITSPDLMQPAD